jgi:hypothetical protein
LLAVVVEVDQVLVVDLDKQLRVAKLVEIFQVLALVEQMAVAVVQRMVVKLVQLLKLVGTVQAAHMDQEVEDFSQTVAQIAMVRRR